MVIPTYQRHDDVLRAVRSVLSQQLSLPFEVIVVNDGPDPIKRQLLAALADPRVRFFEAPRRGSASATRNYALEQSTADWIALLDDDDEWLPGKLARQMEVVAAAVATTTIVGGVERVINVDGTITLKPDYAPPTAVKPSSHLFGRRHGFSNGVATSSLVAHRSIFERVQFDESLHRHEDWTWILRADVECGATLVICPELMCVKRLQRPSGLSRPGGFRESQQWYIKHGYLLTPDARAGFVARLLSRKAAADREMRAIPWLVKEVARQGRAGIPYWLRVAMPWLSSSVLRRRIRQWFSPRRDAPGDE